MFSNDIGIDLGTANILIYLKGKGVILDEPSVVAYDKETSRIKAIGEEAKLMLGRTPGGVVAVRPLANGVISDYAITEKMLKYFIEKAIGKHRFFKPVVSVCVPCGCTEVEKKAVEDATYAAGAKYVEIIEEPIAAAIGANLDISKPYGHMVVDIGGGTTDIAIISLGGTVYSNSIKTAGCSFDQAIIDYMRREYKMIIGERTAEEIKIKIGSCHRRSESVSMDVKGRELVSGLPKTIKLTSEDTEEALSTAANQITDAIHKAFEAAPAELAADIADRGIVLTGGGALLYGIDELIEEKTGITTMVAENARRCVVVGTGKYVEILNKKNVRKLR